ncbi:MAG: hypothetical protein NVS3B15_07410 [Sediminibacterium sp.]
MVSLLAIACNKSASSGNAGPKLLAVHLTDDPAMFSSVFIDIKYVEVKIDENLEHDSHFADNDVDADDDHQDHDQFGKWDTLSIRPGVYDIMKFRNGLDTVLAKGNIPVGRIGKIRLTLGTNNSVIVSNVSYPLALTPGKNNYVYVKIEENDLDETPSGQIGLWIDFDLSASIQENNGVFYLKPTLKAFGMEKFGRIEGKVLPVDAHAVVKAYIGKDTATAIPDDGDGDYKIRGLKEGNYSVLFKASNGYRDTTLTNISVRSGKETEIPAITLHK